jgi:hypothetical protein
MASSSGSGGGGSGTDFYLRRWVAILLTCFLGIILILDAILPNYDVDPVVTGSILGAIVAVVGVDVSKRFGGGNGNGGTPSGGASA